MIKDSAKKIELRYIAESIDSAKLSGFKDVSVAKILHSETLEWLSRSGYKVVGSSRSMDTIQWR